MNSAVKFYELLHDRLAAFNLFGGMCLDLRAAPVRSGPGGACTSALSDLSYNQGQQDPQRHR